MSYRLRGPRGAKGKYWSAIITPPDGPSWEKSTGCERKTEARVVAQRWDREAALSRNQISIEKALEALREHMIDKRDSPERMEMLALKAAHLLGFFTRERPIDAIQRADTTAYVRHRRVQGVSDTTIGMELGFLRAALWHLRENDLYDGDPSKIYPDDILEPAEPRKTWLTLDQWERLYLAMGPVRGYYRKQPKGERYADRETQWIDHDEGLGRDWRELLVVYSFTGMRRREPYRMEATHVDGDHIAIPGTKTAGAKRRIPMHEMVQPIFEQRASDHPSGPLFPITSPTMKAQEVAWNRALRKGAKRAGIPHVSTNDLRRTFCSWCWQDGIDLDICVSWLGHASRKMVEMVYAHMSKEAGRAHMAKLRKPGTHPGHGHEPKRLKTSPRIPHNEGRIVAFPSNRSQQKP